MMQESRFPDTGDGSEISTVFSIRVVVDIISTTAIFKTPPCMVILVGSKHEWGWRDPCACCRATIK